MSALFRKIKAPWPRRVERRMGKRYLRAEQLVHRVQRLLGIFSAKDVLPLEFKPAYSVDNHLSQHLDELEQERERKGGVVQALNDHFARVHWGELRCAA